MHGLPHDVDRDLAWQEAFEHLLALSNTGRPIRVLVGSLTSTGLLRFVKSLDPDPDDPASGEQPRHVFHVGDHGGLLIHPAEFRSGHLWTLDGDDYFSLTLDLAVPIRFADCN